MSDLHELFSDEQPSEVPAVEPEATTSEVTTEPVEATETTEEASKGDEVTATPAATEDQPTMVPLASLQSEKRKRQAAQRELEAERRRHEPKQEPIDPYADPEGAEAQRQEQIRLAEENARINLSVQMFKRDHDGYEEIESKFIDLVEENPSLARQMRDAEYPAEFVYDVVQKQQVRDEIGDDPVAYKQRLKEQAKAEALAELEKSPDSQKIPSLANVNASSTTESRRATLPGLADHFSDKKY